MMSDHYDRYNGMENLLGTNLAEVGTDCISRQQAIDALENDKAALDKIIKGMSAEDMLLKYYVAQHNQVSCDIDAIVQLPPIQPEIVRCKDCKHWKDSDGVFRRGIGVESKCPLNLHQVYEGTFYCGLGERREVTT